MDEKLVAPCPHCERTDPVWRLRDFFGFNRDRSHAEYQPPVDFVGGLALQHGRTLERRLQPPTRPHWRAAHGNVLTILISALYRAFLLAAAVACVSTWLAQVLGFDLDLWSVAVVLSLVFYPVQVGWMLYVGRRAAREVPRWQRAFARWAALYYCARCDVVFEAGARGRRLPPEDLPAYLYEMA